MRYRWDRVCAAMQLIVVILMTSPSARADIVTPTRYWRNTFEGEAVNYASAGQALDGGAAAYCAHPSNAGFTGCVHLGTVPRQITNTSGYDLHPSWSKRGIVFSSDRNSSSGDLKVWIVQPVGSGLRKVGDFDGRHPAWLPDGEIVFADDGVPSTVALSFISAINPATAQKRVVVDVQGYFSGRMPVAILSTKTVDANTVDRSTVTFGRTGSERSLAACDKALDDVNGDGIPDLTCRFATRFTGFQAGGTQGVLGFSNTAGVAFEGRDPVTLVGTDDPEDFKD